MIQRTVLKRIAVARLADAEALFKAKRYDGAIYLCGYTVELGLKFRICQTLRWKAFPETSAEFKDLMSFKTHDFNTLLRLSGIEERVKLSYLAEWSIVKQWKPEMRYSKTGSSSPASANQMITATQTLLKIL